MAFKRTRRQASYYEDVIDDLKRSERAADIDFARYVAGVWREALNKSFEEMR